MIDNVSAWVYANLNPISKTTARTTLGGILGYTLDFFRNALSPIIRTVAWLDMSNVTSTHMIILGVFILHFRIILGKIFGAPSNLSDEIEARLELLRISFKEGKFNKVEIKAEYRNLLLETALKNNKATKISTKNNSKNNEPEDEIIQ